MKCVDRKGNIIIQSQIQNKIVHFLYRSSLGRILLRQLIKPWVSNISGIMLNSSFSKVLIPPFVKLSKINMEEYEERKYSSYNDFFTRKIKLNKREIDYTPEHLISPCDGRLKVYKINENSRFTIKNTQYTLETLLKNKELADYYKNGLLLLFRLTVKDYHRYCYIDDGIKNKNYRIKGVFHTVNPIAYEKAPVYKENTREYTILNSENFGKILIMEVGALLVGKIINYHEEGYVKRGEEKGRFEFGGSTIIVCIKEGRAVIDKDIWNNSRNGIETLVRMGEKIGNVL